jgi:orotate phosphoribosyltransferase
LSTTNDKKQQLLELIKQKGIVIEDVTLSSGEKSEYYYDLKKVVGDPKGINLLTDLLLEEIIIPKFGDARSIGGLEAGAIAIAAAVILKHPSRYKNGMRMFYVRKNPKPHGLEKKIEGDIAEPVVILDDVITKGRSVIEAIEAVTKDGYDVEGVVCAIDREDEQNKLRKYRTPYYPLFTHSDFKSFIEKELKKKKKQKIHSEQ